MWYIYDKVEKKTVSRHMFELYLNAVRACQAVNIQRVGIEELEKAECDRRYVVKETI